MTHKMDNNGHWFTQGRKKKKRKRNKIPSNPTTNLENKNREGTSHITTAKHL